MKKIFLVLLFLNAGYFFAQRTDSLLLALKNHPKEDAEKIKIYNALSAAIMNFDGAKAKAYALEAKELSVRLSDDKNLAESQLSFAQACTHTGEFELALRQLELAQQLFQKLNDAEGLTRCTMRM